MVGPVKTRYITRFALLGAVLGGLLTGTPSPAAAEEATPLAMDCKFPIVEGISGERFDFDILLIPTSNELAGRYEFDLETPPGWTASVWRPHPSQRLAAIDFNGRRVTSDLVEVIVEPAPGKAPEPGEYVTTFNANWGEHHSSIDLTVIITAKYSLELRTSSGRLNDEIASDGDKHMTMLVDNTGTKTLENIALTSTKPDGWSITFTPANIKALEAGEAEQIDVLMRPTERLIARDYTISVSADSPNATDDMELRLSAATPLKWSAGGIAITAAVIAGLVFLFRHLSLSYLIKKK